MKEFPEMIGWSNWGSLMCDAELFEPLVRRALAACGLPQFGIEAGFPGTHAVFRAGDAVVKLYAPLGIPDEYAERRAYRAARHLPMIPSLLGEGVLVERGIEWPYIVVGYMPGRAAREVWDSLPGSERRRAMAALGEWTRLYHALPDPFDTDSPLSAKGFARARDALVEKNRAGLSGCEAFVQSAAGHIPNLAARREPVLLHADLTEDHLLIGENGYAVIDLADSRMGFEPMEWICVWFELCRMNREAFLTFIEASGRNWSALARMDMMACALLHGFGANILNNWIKRTGKSAEILFPEV